MQPDGKQISLLLSMPHLVLSLNAITLEHGFQNLLLVTLFDQPGTHLVLGTGRNGRSLIFVLQIEKLSFISFCTH